MRIKMIESNLFKTLANRPELMKHVLSCLHAVMMDGEVDRKLKELIALRVSKLNKCEYCSDVHYEELKGLGFDSKEIDRMENRRNLSKGEKLALDYAEKITINPHDISDQEFENLKAHFTDGEIVEITSVAGFFCFINRFLESLSIRT